VLEHASAAKPTSKSAEATPTPRQLLREMAEDELEALRQEASDA
jgi:hypothetical protein